MQLRQGFWIFPFAIALLSVSLIAQTAGTISGVVQDESAAVIPGANVTITNADTGISRTVVSDADGRYAVPGLNPGQYDLQAEKMGFGTEVRKGVTLNVGSVIVIQLVLKVGQVTTKTEVTAEAPIVETARNELGTLVEGSAARDLPLNIRSFDHLVALESSAPAFRPSTGNNAIGFNTQYTINGGLQTTNVYMMDGLEMVGGAVATSSPGGVLGVNFGVDAIQEFKVLTGSYNAEFGKRSGAIINIATRSGTNQLHGSGFEFIRNSDVDARGFFDQGSPTPYKRNQFGGTVGGPIKKDKIFYFGNFEGLQLRQSTTALGEYLDTQGRLGYLPCSQTKNVVCNNATGLAFVGVSPNMQPYLFLLPPINTGVDYGNGAGENIRVTSSPANAEYYLGRTDVKISEKDSLLARYTQTDQWNNSPSGYGFYTPYISHDKAALLTENRIISANTLNTARVGFTQAFSQTDTLPATQSIDSGDYIPGANNPALAFTGLGAPFVGRVGFNVVGAAGGPPFGGFGSGTPHRPYTINTYDANDQVSHQVGAHSLTFGGGYQRLQHNEKYSFYDRGSYTFATLQGLITAQPTTFIGADVNTCPQSVTLQNGSQQILGGPGSQDCNDGNKGYRQHYIYAFLNDDWKLTRTVTLNAGLRYEIMTVPTEVNNRISNFVPAVVNGNLTVATQPVYGSPFYDGHHDLFEPRIGIAWDVFGNGKTAVRSGFGLYYDQITNMFMEDTSNNQPFYNSVQVTNPGWPSPFANGAVGLLTGDGIDPRLKVPARLQYNISIQQQITPSTSITLGYVGAHAYHLIQITDPNTAIPQILPQGTPGCNYNPCEFYAPGLKPRNPLLGVMDEVYSNGDDSYQALQFDFTQRLSHGLRSKASFTWSKNISDNADGFDTSYNVNDVQIAQQQQLNSAERGLSPFDVGRNLVLNMTYDLPFNKGPQKLVKGWQFSAIETISDGTPVTLIDGFKDAPDDTKDTADRPNLVNSIPGCSNNPLTGMKGPTVSYFNASCFVPAPAGFYGNLGRETLIGPGFANLDVTLEKSTNITERFKILFRAEAFNLLNRAQFAQPSVSLFNSNGSPNPTAGLITALLPGTLGRQFQLGLKFLF